MDIVPNRVGNQVDVTVNAGQKVRMRILNADGSEASVLRVDVVPAGKTLTGYVYYRGLFL